MSKTDNLRILIIAEQANPTWTSVPLVGYYIANEILKKTNNSLVLTQIRNREALLSVGWVEGVNFCSIDSEFIARPLHRISNMLRGGDNKGWAIAQVFSSISYYWFEFMVYKLYKNAIKNRHFDIVHRVTPLSMTSSSMILANLCKSVNVPFIIGPLNGGLHWPRTFLDRKRSENEWLSSFRSFYKLLPGVTSMYKNSNAIIAGSKNTCLQLSKYYEKLFYVPENGINVDLFNIKNEKIFQSPLQVIFVGRLVACKSVDLILEAIVPLLTKRLAQLSIVGDGPERAKLECMAIRLGITDRVRFCGNVPYDQIPIHYGYSQVLCFPSIREFGGSVVLEAMAMGVVPIVIDYGGPSEFVTEEVGYKIKLTSNTQIIYDIRSILTRILENPTEWKLKSNACLERIANYYTWDTKVNTILSIYKWAQRNAMKTSFEELIE